MKRILFQGDSITDAGRDRGVFGDLGHGYAKFSQLLYQAKHPEMEVEFLNRGVSGDRIADLRNRLVEDCIELKPDIVSIMIGINDTWRAFDSNEIKSIESYEKDFRYIIESILVSNPESQIILAEPFVLPEPEDRKLWREDLNARIQVVGKLGKVFNIPVIEYDVIFNKAMMYKSPTYWAADGVHPTQEGHMLMALHWLDALEGL